MMSRSPLALFAAILFVLGELLEGREPDLGSKLRFG